jgi:hypothetical protein
MKLFVQLRHLRPGLKGHLDDVSNEGKTATRSFEVLARFDKDGSSAVFKDVEEDVSAEEVCEGAFMDGEMVEES